MEGRVRVRKWNQWEVRLTKIPQIVYFPVSTISIFKVNFKNKVSLPTAQEVKYVCSLGKWGGVACINFFVKHRNQVILKYLFWTSTKNNTLIKLY